MDSTVLLTDTLPTEVDFARWVDRAGATENNDVITWNGAVDVGAAVTISFQVTNTASGGAAITNTATFSGTAQADNAQAVYTATSTCYPTTFGNWGQAFGNCTVGHKWVIPAGVIVTLDQDIELDGDFEIEPGGTFNPNGKTVTLSGSAAQTLTGNPLTFYNLVINKSSKSDTVTIDGKLKVTRKLTVRSGKLISASNYGDIEIKDQGELELTNDITVSGHFTMTGNATFTPNTYAVIFDGATEQNVAWENHATFWNLTVMTGTTLIEVNPAYNVVVDIELTNYGVIRKTRLVSGLESYIFGLAGYYPEGAGGGEMELAVTDLSGADPLTAIQVDRIDANHPNAPGGATTDIYWTITPAGANYVATVVLPQNARADPLACRYTSGAWDCARSSFDSVSDLTVTRAGVTAFSAWAVFNTIATTTTLSTSASPSPVFTQVTFTATVAPATATGSVEFFADGASMGTAALTAGKAQMATAGLAVGAHIITATLVPSGPYLAISGMTAAGKQAAPTGQVRFSDEQGELATVGLVNGIASFSRDTWAVGTHTVTAEYLGDSLFAASPLAQVVGKHGTATSLATSPNPAQAGATIVMTATVEKQVSILKQLQPAEPSGQVQFRIAGGDVLGTANLVGNTAIFTKNDFARGVYTIVAEYLGDVNFTSSTSDGVQQIVSPPLTARNDAAGTLQGEAVQIDPLANDIDPAGGGLMVSAVTQPASGSVAIDSGAKTVTFTPAPAFTGVVTFIYTVRDIYGITDEALVAVVVSAADQTGNAPQIGVVDNASGSTLDFDSDRFQVQVQVPAGSHAGALGEKDVFYFAFTKVVTPTGDMTQPPGTFSFAGVIFHLSAFLNGSDLGHYAFASPLTLVITYDPALLGGLSERLLTPFYWNGTAWANDGMSITHIDTATHQMTNQIWHLSEFALFAQPPLSTPSYLFFPAVANGSNLVTAQAAAATPTDDAPAAEEIPTTVPEPAPEQPATPEVAPPVGDSDTPAADEAAAKPTPSPDGPAATDVTSPGAEPTPEAAARLHLPLVAR